jgi:hypothetical protein
MSLDQVTWLILHDAGATYTIVAGEIGLNAAVEPDMLSTDLPAGAQDAAHPRIEDFRLPQVGGGQSRWPTFRRRWLSSPETPREFARWWLGCCR